MHQKRKVILARFMRREQVALSVAPQTESGERSTCPLDPIDELRPRQRRIAWANYASRISACVSNRSNDVDDRNITALMHLVGCHDCICRFCGVTSLVRAEHDLGDTTRLVGALAFEGEFHRALYSARDV